METPTSFKRITRSQSKAAMHSASKNNVLISRKIENSDQAVSKSRKRNEKQNQDNRSALVDISNDSPIVGVAMGSLETPSSKHKNNSRIKNNTPGSGETLLRGQVKTLLQMVEEDADVFRFPVEDCPIIRLQGFLNSPSVFAPTPANTPQIPNLSENSNIMNNGFGSIIYSPIVEDLVKITQETDSPGITRSLLLDFYEKSEESPNPSDSSSVLTYQGVITGVKDRSPEDDVDNSSVWSIQVNASTTTHDDDEDEEVVEEVEEEGEAECDGGDGGGGGELLDELCEGISQMKIMSKFSGKRVKFVYNSEDEIVEEETNGPLDVLRLKGWPTPKGKHLRFVADDEADD